ncbi:hypothetical protein [Nocardioides speluncae]|uniref:hypothetical protein n=1 Tax=Nocardioides speluncae TaxID=2670337 RepID=UPI000D68D949|nr:hypothetical protein [Nocardioides speluncae]
MITERPAETSAPDRGAARQASLIIGIFVVVGAGCGVLWERFWTAPTGIVFEGKWYLVGPDAVDSFDGTGRYILIAAIAGLLLGTVLSLALDRDEVATLVGVAVGSLLAALVMAWVGNLLGPPDPRELAPDKEDSTELVSDLRVEGRSPYVAFPAGALTGAVIVWFGLSRRA